MKITGNMLPVIFVAGNGNSEESVYWRTVRLEEEMTERLCDGET
jgi:hypothetical protein